MLDAFFSMFAYSFIVRAFLVGLPVALCAALLGVTLVLKRYSMIGDGLSHIGFGALAFAAALNIAPLSISVPVILAAAFLLLRIDSDSKIKGDAAIALISTGSLAVGVLAISLSKGTSVDFYNYLFGSILSVSRQDVWASAILSLLVVALYLLFYHKIFAVTFDEDFAKATGIKASRYNMLIALLSAVTIVIGMRIMGTLLVSSLIIFPPLTSMKFFKRFRSVVISSVCVSAVCFILGMVLSYFLQTPTGATIVVMNIFAFAVFSAAGGGAVCRLKKRFRRAKQRKKTADPDID